jgi:excisionase family DNA binding protein
MSAAREETVLPPRDAETLAEVEELLRSGHDPLRIVTADGGEAVLPDELRRVLTTVVSSMHRGQAVTLAPLAMRLTTQQAADLLGVSRPTLIKLLEEGRIPYETPNRHRRIRLVDLLNFQQTRQAERRDVLAQMAREAQDLGLYEGAPEDYEAAMAEARRKLA